MSLKNMFAAESEKNWNQKHNCPPDLSLASCLHFPGCAGSCSPPTFSLPLSFTWKSIATNSPQSSITLSIHAMRQAN